MTILLEYSIFDDIKFNLRYSIELMRLVAVLLITFTHTRHIYESGTYFFLFEELPKIGTVMLSIISGFLYWEMSRNRKTIFSNKTKTLLLPFIIANLIVLLFVCVAYYFFNYNFLNRYQFNFSLITEGILSLNEAPLNPPTYFIRDIFIVFVLIELVRHRDFWMLLILIPLAIFGKLLLRVDILMMFIVGISISLFMNFIEARRAIILLLLFTISIVMIIYTPVNMYKYPVALLCFISILNAKFGFVKTGGFTYLLHLYHSPIIIASYPFIKKFHPELPVLNVLLQVFSAILVTAVLFLITRRFRKLRIICGDR